MLSAFFFKARKMEASKRMIDLASVAHGETLATNLVPNVSYATSDCAKQSRTSFMTLDRHPSPRLLHVWSTKHNYTVKYC